jgi:hypothetical protein
MWNSIWGFVVSWEWGRVLGRKWDWGLYFSIVSLLPLLLERLCKLEATRWVGLELYVFTKNISTGAQYVAPAKENSMKKSQNIAPLCQQNSFGPAFFFPQDACRGRVFFWGAKFRQISTWKYMISTYAKDFSWKTWPKFARFPKKKL